MVNVYEFLWSSQNNLMSTVTRWPGRWRRWSPSSSPRSSSWSSWSSSPGVDLPLRADLSPATSKPWGWNGPQGRRARVEKGFFSSSLVVVMMMVVVLVRRDKSCLPGTNTWAQSSRLCGLPCLPGFNSFVNIKYGKLLAVLSSLVSWKSRHIKREFQKKCCSWLSRWLLATWWWRQFCTESILRRKRNMWVIWSMIRISDHLAMWIQADVLIDLVE